MVAEKASATASTYERQRYKNRQAIQNKAEMTIEATTHVPALPNGLQK